MTPDGEAGQGLRQSGLGGDPGPGQQLVQRDWPAGENDRGGGVIQRPDMTWGEEREMEDGGQT